MANIKKKEKEVDNFSENLKTFILVNNISYEDFAKKLNVMLLTNNHSGKTYYDGKDIRSFAYRSCPRDKIAMVTIAKIIGKELSDLIMTKYEEAELYLKVENVCEDPLKKKLEQLTTEEHALLLSLASTAEYDREKGMYYKICDVGIFYNSGLDVRSFIYLCDGKLDLKLEKWSWTEYGNRISEYDNNEVFAIESALRDRFFEKLSNLGFVKDYYCTENGLSADEFDEAPDKVFSLDIFLSLTEEEYRYFANELAEILETREKTK
ncbi:MAG: hypothetical protein J6C23_00005 [Clostridia bacterium]|nr:hypothetical protein [Clostridia bacterium]